MGDAAGTLRWHTVCQAYPRPEVSDPSAELRRCLETGGFDVPAGAADYTPSYLFERIPTRCSHQLALPVVFFSPVQFLFWYIYRPGSDLYVVYNQGWDTDVPDGPPPPSSFSPPGMPTSRRAASTAPRSACRAGAGRSPGSNART